ncbi:MAG: lamin tail domain-containing protein [Ignavibacteriales bacterium]|nr:lamin tail domain-containing protein [Ignavibacteriales bacterium]
MKKNALLVLFLLSLLIGEKAFAQTLVMNEIYSRGVTADPDWIELYNPFPAPLDITGYKIYDSGGQTGTKPKHTAPAGTIVPANGFLVVVVDVSDSSGFGLSSSGETVWLENATGTVIDTIAFPALGIDTSYGRKPDGSAAWQKLTPTTKGTSNSGTIVLPLSMNEIYSRGVTADPDWIEVYNPNTSALDITGYKIYDAGGQSGTKPKKIFPAGTSVPAKGFFVIVTDIPTATDSSGFGLSSSGETVWLENAGGAIIDSIAFPGLGIDTSYGRRPDGAAVWQKLTPTTKGTSNAGSVVAALVMNEIFARGVPGDLDWIEIYNGHSVSVDLTGYKIYDSGGQVGTKPKKVFPAGVVIPAKGFYVIITDDTDSSGFGLSSSGEDVWLENAVGTVIDQVKFLATANVTQSYGRSPDGATWQILNIITKGTSNGTNGILDEASPASNFALAQNYPNPFNPSTVINYQLAQSGFVSLKVYNLLGKEIATLVNSPQAAGNYSLNFSTDQYHLASGVYIYILKADGFTSTKKMVLIR